VVRARSALDGQRSRCAGDRSNGLLENASCCGMHYLSGALVPLEPLAAGHSREKISRGGLAGASAPRLRRVAVPASPSLPTASRDRGIPARLPRCLVDMIATERAVNDSTGCRPARLEPNPWRWCSIPPGRREALNKVGCSSTSGLRGTHPVAGLAAGGLDRRSARFGIF